jgi:hypothetical protein
MYLTELEAPRPNGRENKSYIWICNECPGILLEWWDHTDTDAFINYIERHEGVIKQWEDEQEETNASTKQLLDGEY